MALIKISSKTYNHAILFLIIILSSLFILSCQSESMFSEKEELVLKSAGENKPELLKVINHYKTVGDSLKLEAAHFLIAEMYGQYTIVPEFRNSNGDVIDFDWKKYHSTDSVYHILDSLGIRKKNKIVMDCNIITADFLISNIDKAFYAWRRFPWARNISFKVFCTSILPYKAENEMNEDFRSYFLNKYDVYKDSTAKYRDIESISLLINKEIDSLCRYDQAYLPLVRSRSFGDILRYKKGHCEDIAAMKLFAFRSLAIPSTIESTPAWARRFNFSHRETSFMNSLNKMQLAKPNAFKFKAAKVMRMVSGQESSEYTTLKDLVKDDNSIPAIFKRKGNWQDITKERTITSDIVINGLSKDAKNKVAYLCIFNTGKWKAISWSKINNQQVIFKNMGREILYVLAYYHKNSYSYAGKAFFLDSLGNTYYKNDLIQNSIYKTFTQFGGLEKFNKLKHGESYSLQYFDLKEFSWKNLGTQYCSDSSLLFKNVPKNGICRLTNVAGTRRERPFLTNNGKHVWL